MLIEMMKASISEAGHSPLQTDRNGIIREMFQMTLRLFAQLFILTPLKY